MLRRKTSDRGGRIAEQCRGRSAGRIAGHFDRQPGWEHGLPRGRELDGESGQTILEYLLILFVVVTIFMVAARPFFGDFSKKFESLGKKGFFAEDTSGANFYYYPL